MRNLGRDDRVIAGNSLECRFPFLDIDLVTTAINMIPIQHMADFDMPRGEGDKQLLRSLASDIGLEATSGFAKKAMQFGTGIAKMSNIKKFGSNRAAKGVSKYEID